MDKDKLKFLESIVEQYGENKEQADFYKKITDTLNKDIKSTMADLDIEEITSSSYTARKTTTYRQDFNEDALITKIRELGKQRGIIKKKEYVDMDALESAIYHGKINAAELESCQTSKEVVTLRVTKKRGEE